MKNIYKKPEIRIVKTEIESLLAAESGGQLEEGHSRRHNPVSDLWNEEEDAALSWPRSKSLWDD